MNEQGGPCWRVWPSGDLGLLCYPGHRSGTCSEQLRLTGSCAGKAGSGCHPPERLLSAAGRVCARAGGGPGRVVVLRLAGQPGSLGTLSAGFSGVCLPGGSADLGGGFLCSPHSPTCCPAPSALPGPRELLQGGRARGPGAETAHSWTRRAPSGKCSCRWVSPEVAPPRAVGEGRGGELGLGEGCPGCRGLRCVCGT